MTWALAACIFVRRTTFDALAPPADTWYMNPTFRLNDGVPKVYKNQHQVRARRRNRHQQAPRWPCSLGGWARPGAI